MSESGRMRASNLTPAMKAALAAMPFAVTVLDGKPMTSLPGKFTMRTLLALQSRGLAYCRSAGTFRLVWQSRLYRIIQESSDG